MNSEPGFCTGLMGDIKTRCHSGRAFSDPESMAA
jgi:hypothetical protein